MKKKFLVVLFLCVCVIFCTIGFTACEDSPVSFKLNFFVDNVIVKTIDTTGNEVISVPNNPEKEGYTFEGWFWDKDTWQRPFTANSLLNEPLSSDMSVYAKFSENHIHSYSEQVFEPTCTEQGYSLHTCSCGDVYKDTYVNAKGHTYSTKWTTDNTYHWHTATCEHTSEIKNKAKHTAGDWIIDKNATYEKAGSKHKECIICKKVLETVEIPQLVKDAISFKTLDVDDNLNVYGKVPNTQTIFSFINEVKVSGNATFVVSTDIYGIQQIPTKTVPLEIGDNTFYITETVGNNIRLFTVTVRRKPVYTLTFDTNGGTSVEIQQVEEDSIALKPKTTKLCHNFVSCDYDFDLPVTK
ncbi:MAG: InlB B-repeat-containing protein, partial [Clostridia bacterium]|nr:InlB B-repeat-containing protein [Clostridia bacterium]